MCLFGTTLKMEAASAGVRKKRAQASPISTTAPINGGMCRPMLFAQLWHRHAPVGRLNFLQCANFQWGMSASGH
jgi:hypothetical protein